MSKKFTQDEFITKAKSIHKNRYDYSLVNYKSMHTKIDIVCKIHGSFLQLPYHHTQYHGCPKCGDSILSNKNDFITKANLIHNNKYDYSKVQYINCMTKVCIICHKHGNFFQRPNDHLNDRGCPKCNTSKGELTIEHFLKEHNIQYNIQKRFKDCRNKLPLPFDFYLPDHNTCIEFDGKQHFLPWNGKNTKKYIDKLTDIQSNDSIKTKYCQLNNIRLIRIKYTDVKNIENIISKI